MQFTVKYLDQVIKRLEAVPANFVDGYSVEIDGDWGMPPVFDVVRVLGELSTAGGLGGISIQTQEMVLRHAIKGRMVTVRYKGKELGKFQSNTVTDDLNNFDVLKNNPPAVMLMSQLAMARLLEKSLPPQNDAPAAAAGIQEQGRSSSAK
jgi:hypothetical protein